MIRWRLDRFLTEHGLDVGRVARRTGLSTNTLYPLARGEARRIDRTTLATLLEALADLTGSSVAIADVLTHETWRGGDGVEALADEAARRTSSAEGVGLLPLPPLLPSAADVVGAVLHARDARAVPAPPARAEPDADEDSAWLERLLG